MSISSQLKIAVSVFFVCLCGIFYVVLLLNKEEDTQKIKNEWVVIEAGSIERFEVDEYGNIESIEATNVKNLKF